jgi:SNF2 family DNA or RNA helicase
MVTETRLTVSPQGKLWLYIPFADRQMAIDIGGFKFVRPAFEWPISQEIIDKIRKIPGVYIEPKVYEKLKCETDQDAQLLQAKLDPALPVIPYEPMPVHIDPTPDNPHPQIFRHQILGYNMGITKPGAGLFFEQGCGKTLTGIAIAGRRYQRGEVKRVLICAPASVVPVWPGEFDRYASFPFRCVSLSDDLKNRARTLRDWQDSDELQIVVTNYEGIARGLEGFCRSWAPDMIILDESQRIKTPSAAQSTALHRLGRVAKYTLLLSGTPITNTSLDIWSQYAFMDPAIFGNSFFAFKRHYCQTTGQRLRADAQQKGFSIYKKYTKQQLNFLDNKIERWINQDEFMQKFHASAVRVTKAEALDLPQYTNQTLFCDLEPAAENVYKTMVRESAAELRGGTITAANILSRLLRLSQITGGFLVPDDAEHVEQVSKAKQKILKEQLTDLIDAGHKIVIFYRFTAEGQAIQDLASNICKNGVAGISGATPMHARGDLVKRFQTDPDCRIFCAQTRAAGLGITLTAADIAIFYSLDYSFADYDQARCRIHRIGQHNPCTYIHLIAKGTIDQKIMEALAAKKNLAESIVDNWQIYFE